MFVLPNVQLELVKSSTNVFWYYRGRKAIIRGDTRDLWIVYLVCFETPPPLAPLSVAVVIIYIFHHALFVGGRLDVGLIVGVMLPGVTSLTVKDAHSPATCRY